jgi:hypothetical protein
LVTIPFDGAGGVVVQPEINSGHAAGGVDDRSDDIEFDDGIGPVDEPGAARHTWGDLRTILGIEGIGIYSRSAPPPFPKEARMAGLLWMLLGSCFVLISCGSAIALVAMRVKHPGLPQPQPTEGCTTWIGVIMGVGFFTSGRRIRRGTAADTLATSILSILLGMLYLAVIVIGILTMQDGDPALVVAGLVTTFFSVVVGGVLLTSGWLGLKGRSRYRAWRAAIRATRRQRRRYRGPGPSPEAAD